MKKVAEIKSKMLEDLIAQLQEMEDPMLGMPESEEPGDESEAGHEDEESLADKIMEGEESGDDEDGQKKKLMLMMLAKK